MFIENVTHSEYNLFFNLFHFNFLLCQDAAVAALKAAVGNIRIKVRRLHEISKS
jgi:hypothetical protein